jgi:hypothetical protein
MSRFRIAIRAQRRAALAAAALFWLSSATGVPAAGAPPARTPAPGAGGAIARVGDRVIDESDIRVAAAAMADSPLRRRNPALWRKALVDRCIDREILAAEAERRGYLADPEVQRRIHGRDYELLLGELYRRVLIPGIEPTKPQLDSLRATRLYRGVDLDYILVSAGLAADAKQIAERLRQGARFDSTARLWSQHPSASNGGHFGWVLARELAERSHAALSESEPGDVLGPYSGPFGHEIYRVRAFNEISADSLYNLVKAERTRGLLTDYQAGLLKSYHFALDTTQVNPMLLLAATEPVARILASLDPDGTRSAAPGRRALGILARADGDSVTFRDLADVQSWSPGAKMSLQDRDALYARCAAALIPRLVVRDARARGLDQDPVVGRALRMAREQEATRVMVARESGGPPDSTELQAYFAKNAARYQRPRATRARAICFDRDSAGVGAAALRSWLVAGLADSALSARGFKPQPRATATTLWPGWYAEVTLLASDSDPVSVAARGLAPGSLSALVQAPQGLVVVEALERLAPRPLTYDEVAPEVRLDAAADRANRWIAGTLPKLRTATSIRVEAARLAQVRLDTRDSKKGTN